MNEHLQERFRRSTRPGPGSSTVEVLIQPPRLNPLVREYFQPKQQVQGGGAWLSKTEIPTSEEILDLDTSSQTSSEIVELTPNRPSGAWESKQEYLSTQYELFREDAVRGLRECVSMMRITPDAAEAAFNGKVGIYEKVLSAQVLVGVSMLTRLCRSAFAPSVCPLVALPTESHSVSDVWANRSFGSSQSV